MNIPKVSAAETVAGEERGKEKRTIRSDWSWKYFPLLVSKQPNKAVSTNIADSELILAGGDAFRDDLLGLKNGPPIFFFLISNPR